VARKRAGTGLTQWLVTASSAALIYGTASAQTPSSDVGPDTITVTATRAPLKVIDAPATVSVITDVEIEDNLVEDIKDIVRFEPGVSVRNQPSRFSAALSSTGRDGNAGFNIRGLDGNRVLIQTDGIRLPDSFSFGAQSVGRGDYADLDLVKSVEILRGPASALYGSDGLAGAVSFTTRDPADLLAEGANFGGRARVGYSEADNGWAKGVAIAARNGNLSFLTAYTRRDSGPQKNQGNNDSANVTRTTPNPQQNDSNAVLAKLLLEPNESHRLRLTYEHQDRDSATQALSARAIPPLGATSTRNLDALDQLRRNRISLDWRYTGRGTIKSVSAAIYRQTSATRQFSSEDRNISADRTRDNRFDNRVTGVSALVEARFGINSLLVGGDYSNTQQSGTRDGTIPPFGETFPTRAFPVTDYVQAGMFVQDSINIGDGRLLLYPGVRFDYYKLTPKPDALFPGTPTIQSDTHVSPKLGSIIWATDTVGLFASYAEGFRSPTPSQVNNGFTNLAQGYTSIANPDLKPETSTAFEGGLRLRGAELGGIKLTASATGFYGKYRNFIEQRQISGTFGSPVTPAVFQFVNVGRVRLSGVEGRADLAFGSGFGATVSASYTDGEANSGIVTTPLSSVDPFKLVAGVNYRAPDDRFGGQLILTHSSGKRQSDVSETCSPTCFTGAGFTILDATVFVTLARFATARVGIFNLFDTKYAWWSDVRGLAASSTTLDAYTQPGRNVSASLTLKF
jgi:hemoglobin/transferrin/lactoferrin receptor protein